jgi:hypothetical protein
MDKSPVVDLTVDEFRALIKETVRETIKEWLCETVDPNDPDAGLEFRPEVAARLQAALKEDIGQGRTLDEVAQELGLDA